MNLIYIKIINQLIKIHFDSQLYRITFSNFLNCNMVTDTYIYGLIGAGIALIFLVLVKLFYGKEKKSKAYSFQNKEQHLAQSAELYDSSQETKKHIR